MKKTIHYVKIEKLKNGYQFYLNESPIHPDKMFPKLMELNPGLILVEVFKNDKLFWSVYHPIQEKTDLQKLIWKAYRFKV